MKHVGIHTRIRLVDAVFPDGSMVGGVWTVIGRYGDQLIAESRGTIIRFPERIAVAEAPPGTKTIPMRTHRAAGAR